jgi:hypothetical protein
MEHGFSQVFPSFSSLFLFFNECRSHYSTPIIIWSPMLPQKHQLLFASPPTTATTSPYSFLHRS